MFVTSPISNSTILKKDYETSDSVGEWGLRKDHCRSEPLGSVQGSPWDGVAQWGLHQREGNLDCTTADTYVTLACVDPARMDHVHCDVVFH